jgi:ABC-type hemin transport system ATPase subunit
VTVSSLLAATLAVSVREVQLFNDPVDELATPIRAVRQRRAVTRVQRRLSNRFDQQECCSFGSIPNGMAMSWPWMRTSISG